jgi:hypothetical protein
VNRTVALAIVLALLGCSSPPEDTGPTQRQLLLDRTSVRALRDFLYAGYEVRLLRDHPEHAPTPLDELEAARTEARAELRRALEGAGADPARAAGDDAELLALIGESVRRGGRYAIVFTPNRDSFALVRIRAAEPNRSLVLFDEPFRYDLVVHDETLALDYPHWLAARVAPQAPIRQPATYSSEGTVRLDREAIARIGAEAFLPRIDALRSARDRLRVEASTLALASPEQLPELLTRVKDGLRWRALESLWAGIQARGPEERLQRFVEDYAARAELRAVAELRELARLRQAGDERPLSSDERTLLHELGALSAIVHGDPLGHTADVVALAAASLASGAGASPATAAARRLLGALAAAFRQGEPGAQADALALAALARAEPSRLRELARALHSQRLERLRR